MYRGSVFERIAGNLEVTDNVSDEEALYKSVANNLSRIFSTNMGSAQTALDYGRPDLNNMDMSMKDSIENIEKNSERCIQKYEPRLYHINVAVSREKLRMNQMNIHIEGFLKINGKSHKVYYKADLLSNGKVKVHNNED